MDKNSDNEVRKRNHLSPEEKFQIFIEATVLEQAAELALLKKRSLGIDGNLKGKYIAEDTKGSL